MSRPWTVLAVVALAAAVAGFLLLFERHEETVETGPRGAARFDDYFALERLIEELGVPVTSSRNPLRLPPTDHVLLLVTPVRPPAETYSERLVAWVEAGGHLVATPAGWPAATAAEEDGEDGEEALPAGGDETAEPAPSDPRPTAPASAEDDAEADAPASEVRETDGSRFLDLLAGDDALFERLGVEVVPAIRGAPGLIELRPTAAAEPLRVEVASRLHLQPVDPDVVLHAAGSHSGAVLLRLARGDGRVTLLADGSPLTNTELGEHDHARLAWALLAPEAVPAGVWVADWRVAPGLFELLLRHAGAALAAAAVLLALWLWRSAARFGPPLPAPSGERRSLREHVEAAGAFLWRQGEGDELVAASRRAVARRAEVHFPGWSRLPRREQVARLAEVSRLAPGAVARALDDEVPAGTDAHHFTRTVSILELIRRSL